jgi:hypothetical protein
MGKKLHSVNWLILRPYVTTTVTTNNYNSLVLLWWSSYHRRHSETTGRALHSVNVTRGAAARGCRTKSANRMHTGVLMRECYHCQLVRYREMFTVIPHLWWYTNIRHATSTDPSVCVCVYIYIYSVFHKSIRDLEVWPCSSKPTYKR